MIKYFFFLVLFPAIALSQNFEIVQDTSHIIKINSLNDKVTKEFYKKNYDRTIELGELAVKISKQNDYYKKFYFISSFLGNAYIEIGDTLRAKRIFNEAVTISKLKKDTVGILVSQIDFANFYALQKSPEAKEKAIELYKDLLPLAKLDKNNTNRLQILNSNISEQYLNLDNPLAAEPYLKESEFYLTDSIFIGFKGSTRLNRARYLTQIGKYRAAKPLYEKALITFKELDYLDGIIDVYKYRTENAVAEGNYEEAYITQKKLDEYELVKYETDKLEAIQTVTTRFKLDEIEKQLKDEKLLSDVKAENAKQETSIFWIKIASGILLVFSIVLLYSYLKRKKLLANLIVKNKQYLEEKERSEELSKAKSLLFSNITHELRTPMYGIIGISNILLEDDVKNDKDKYLKSLRFSADYLLSLVNNVLQFNQFENNDKQASEIGAIDIRNLVYNIVESSKYLSAQHPNKYHILIDDTIPNIILGDGTRLSQILINLIGNASKFTNDGSIDVRLAMKEKTSTSISIDFSVIDDGPGISSKVKKNIFDQLKPTEQHQDYMGTGLGLPIVKKLLEEQNSKLNILSQLDKGTTVNFALLFKTETTSTKNTKTEYEPTNIVLKGYSILVVDDNKINLLITRKFIERYGGVVTTLGNGKDSIAAVKNEHIDLVLMDINMPEMNGFEATEAIREFNQKIPIIALTAVEKEKVVGEHSFSLMNDIIIKPYSRDSFLSTIKKHLNNDTIVAIDS